MRLLFLRHIYGMVELPLSNWNNEARLYFHTELHDK